MGKIKKEPKKNTDALRERLSKIDGLSPEQVQHMVDNGVADDIHVVETFYRITGQAAQAVVEAFKEVG